MPIYNFPYYIKIIQKPARGGAKLNLVQLTQCEITFASAFDLERAKGRLFCKNM